MVDSLVASIEILAILISQARATSVAAEVLATASSDARVSAIAVEALVSITEAPSVPTSSQSAAIVLILGA